MNRRINCASVLRRENGLLDSLSVNESLEQQSNKMLRQPINWIKGILKSTDPSDCFELQFYTLTKFGTLYDPSKSRLRNVLSIYPSLLVVLLCVTSLTYLVAEDVPMNDKLQGSFAGITSLLCCIKMYYIRKHQDELLQLLNGFMSRINYINDGETEILCKEAIYPTVVCYLILQAAAFVSCLIYGLFPVGKNNFDKPLPVHGWFPSYFKEGNPYLFSYIIQYMSIVCASSLWVCVDTVNFGLLAIHNAMLKILSNRISKLGWDGNHKGMDQNNNNYKQLCDHVEYHLQITRYQSETNEIYGPMLFAKVTFSVMIVCSFVYTLGMQTDYGKFTAQIGILSVVVATLFMLSWMSQQISATSDDLLNKAVECNFQCMDRKTSKALLIFMQGLYKTIYIEVGSPIKITLSLNMFVTIMDFAYKCLALLKSAD